MFKATVSKDIEDIKQGYLAQLHKVEKEKTEVTKRNQLLQGELEALQAEVTTYKHLSASYQQEI